MPDVLYEEVIEVDERVVLRQDGCQMPRKDPKRIVRGVKRNYELSFRSSHAAGFGQNLNRCTNLFTFVANLHTSGEPSLS